MSRVILPFKIYCMINADCRAYMRVAVIEALPYGAEWLTTHLNTMLKGDGEFLWGTDELPHFSWQFSEIVDTAFVDYALIDHEHIVDVTKNILNNGNYPIILMSCDIIFNGNDLTKGMNTQTFTIILFTAMMTTERLSTWRTPAMRARSSI